MLIGRGVEGEAQMSIQRLINQRTRSSRRGGILQGCLIVLGVLVLIAVIIGIIIAMNWRGWTASGMRAVAEAGIADTSLPQDQKDSITQRLNGLITQFEDGDLSLTQMGSVLEQLATGPMIPGGIVYGSYEIYVMPSGLSEEEKSAAMLPLRRAAKGILDGRIAVEDVDDIIDPVGSMSIGPNGEPNISLTPASDVTDDQVRQLVANATAAAAAAGITADETDVDFDAALGDAIDRALNAGGGRELPPGSVDETEPETEPVTEDMPAETPADGG
jgi:hypothetical protein